VRSTTSLQDRYAAIVCDLDGVVYRGPAAVPHAVDALVGTRLPVIYATNNASRPPADVAAHLRELGLPCGPEAVATSSQAGARTIADRVPPASAVLAVGGPGVAVALEEAGLTPVLPDAVSGHHPVAVLQGYGPQVTATHLAEAAYAVQSGAIWVATNTDATLPTDRGVAPGNGSLVAAVQRAVGRAPDVVAGKPSAPLYLMCADRLAVPAERVLAVGDRLDTDIEGAVAAGMDSLLVLTGVDDLAACLAAPPHRRPTWVAHDLRSLAADATTPGASLQRLSAAVRAVHRAHDEGATHQEIAALSQSAESVLGEVAPR
jgi:glycerol 3-phosphatase-2